MSNTAFSLESDLYLSKHSEEFLSPKRVQLLENITIYGSITKAAKASGITYKTAWAWIDKMNTLATKPLVQRISGGKGGGGTIVTAFAKSLMQRFIELEALHQKHLASLDRSFDDLDTGKMHDFVFSRLNAEIVSISEHESRASLVLKLCTGEVLNAQVPMAFVTVNKLKKEALISVLIESEAVSVSRYSEDELSSTNRLRTRVKEISIQEDEVLLRLCLDNGDFIYSQITYQSFEKLKIQKEDELLAIFKAYNITLLSRGE